MSDSNLNLSNRSSSRNNHSIKNIQMNPFEQYLTQNNMINNFSIKNIPIKIIIETLKFHHHAFDDQYVYGVKAVSHFNQDMFKSITYIDIFCHLPPNLPPYHVGKLGNKSLFLYANSIRVTG